MENPDPLKQLQEEIRAIVPEEYPVCPGCGGKHPPNEHGPLAGIDVISMAKGAGVVLNNIPVEHAVPMIASFVGSFSESIDEDMWTKLLAHEHTPCGEEGCEYHIAMQAFLPELYKLKVFAEEGKKRGQHVDTEEEEK